MVYNPEFGEFVKAQLGLTFPYMGSDPLTSTLAVKIEVDGQTAQTRPGDYIKFDGSPVYQAAHTLFQQTGYNANLEVREEPYQRPNTGGKGGICVKIVLSVPMAQTQDMGLLAKLKQLVEKDAIEREVLALKDRLFSGHSDEVTQLLLNKLGLKRDVGGRSPVD